MAYILAVHRRREQRVAGCEAFVSRLLGIRVEMRRTTINAAITKVQGLPYGTCAEVAKPQTTANASRVSQTRTSSGVAAPLRGTRAGNVSDNKHAPRRNHASPVAPDAIALHGCSFPFGTGNIAFPLLASATKLAVANFMLSRSSREPAPPQVFPRLQRHTLERTPGFLNGFLFRNRLVSTAILVASIGVFSEALPTAHSCESRTRHSVTFKPTPTTCSP
jgi:hypothetical protein